jgi:hypothetical protein
MWLLPWISPTIEDLDPGFFRDCVRQYVDIHRHIFSDPILKRFARQFDEPRTESNDLVKIIIHDDIAAFRTCQYAKRFKTNQTVPPSIFNVHQILQNSSTLLQVAAFFGSVRCFRRIMHTGKSLSVTDKLGLSVAQYAVAGNQMPIIQVLEEHQADFSGVLHIAALYHRYELFDYFFQKDRMALHVTVRPFGSVIHQCAASDNIRLLDFCLQNDININTRDNEGVCLSVTELPSTLRSSRKA